MYGCFLMDGNEFTIYAKCLNLSDNIDDAIKKSDYLLEKKGIMTIVREI